MAIADRSDGYLTSLDQLETNYSSEVSIFPNPAKNLISISAKMKIDFVEIYNMKGQLLLKSTSTEIGLEDFNSGNYIAVIFGRNGILKVEKFVVIK
ncbi:MAG: T9SS type A sorting domain-containing protein [Saprospiraceae bacterium]